MPKRRNVILGMGALAMGSGAVLSGAFDGDVTTPSADFQVLADALRIEPHSESDSNVEFVGSVTAGNEFSRSNLPQLEVLEETSNDALEMSAAAETNEDTTFGSAAGEEPLIIINDTNETYEVQIDYASEVNDDHEDWGYGDDVNDSEASANEPSPTNGLSYERVNGIFVFHTSGEGDAGAQQISPSGTDVSGSSVTLAPEEEAHVQLQVDTTSTLDDQSDTGAINAAVASGGPWGDEDSFLSLLSEVNVVASEQE